MSDLIFFIGSLFFLLSVHFIPIKYYLKLRFKTSYKIKSYFFRKRFKNFNENKIISYKNEILERIKYYVDKNNFDLVRKEAFKLYYLDEKDFIALKYIVIYYLEFYKDKKDQRKHISLYYLNEIEKYHSTNKEAIKFLQSVYEIIGMEDVASTFYLRYNKIRQGEKNKFNNNINSKKTIKTKSGVKVQSYGERLIADFLYEKGIYFDYDKQITLKGNKKNKYGYNTKWIRPDFYLTEFDIIIEYWGMKGNIDYNKEMYNKKRLYKEASKKFIGIEKKDLKSLHRLLSSKLKLMGVNIK